MQTDRDETPHPPQPGIKKTNISENKEKKSSPFKASRIGMQKIPKSIILYQRLSASWLNFSNVLHLDILLRIMAYD